MTLPRRTRIGTAGRFAVVIGTASPSAPRTLRWRSRRTATLTAPAVARPSIVRFLPLPEPTARRRRGRRSLHDADFTKVYTSSVEHELHDPPVLNGGFALALAPAHVGRPSPRPVRQRRRDDDEDGFMESSRSTSAAHPTGRTRRAARIRRVPGASSRSRPSASTGQPSRRRAPARQLCGRGSRTLSSFRPEGPRSAPRPKVGARD